ncbi:MAG: hypothetical protein ABL857_04640 [Rickettsiales bacterium]
MSKYLYNGGKSSITQRLLADGLYNPLLPDNGGHHSGFVQPCFLLYEVKHSNLRLNV